MSYSKLPVPWSTGLWDCFDDRSNCCLTCICPSITFGRIAEIVDKGETSSCRSGGIYTLFNLMFHCGRLYSCGYRSKLRQQYSLYEFPCGDCVVHLFCEPFALCQEYRELKNRGFDMTIGWQGNVEKQNVELAKAPVAEEGMKR